MDALTEAEVSAIATKLAELSEEAETIADTLIKTYPDAEINAEVIARVASLCRMWGVPPSAGIVLFMAGRLFARYSEREQGK